MAPQSRCVSSVRQSGAAGKMLRDERIALRRRRSDRFANTRILGRQGATRRFDPPPAVIPYPHVGRPVDEGSPVEPHLHRHRIQAGDAPLGGSHAQPGFTPEGRVHPPGDGMRSVHASSSCDCRPTPSIVGAAFPSVKPVSGPVANDRAGSPSPTRAVSLPHKERRPRIQKVTGRRGWACRRRSQRTHPGCDS